MARASAGSCGAVWYLYARLSVLETEVPANSAASVTARTIMNAKTQRAFLDNSSTTLSSLDCETHEKHYPFQDCPDEYHDHYNSHNRTPPRFSGH